eukprot:4543012-Pyramimonas_sp.AAC.1
MPWCAKCVMKVSAVVSCPPPCVPLHGHEDARGLAHQAPGLHTERGYHSRAAQRDGPIRRRKRGYILTMDQSDRELFVRALHPS